MTGFSKAFLKGVGKFFFLKVLCSNFVPVCLENVGRILFSLSIFLYKFHLEDIVLKEDLNSPIDSLDPRKRYPLWFIAKRKFDNNIF